MDQLSDLEADLNQVPNGSAWLPYIRANELRQALTSNKSDGVIAAVQKKLDSGSSLKDIQQRQFLARPAFRMLSAALAKLNQAEQTSPERGRPKGRERERSPHSLPRSKVMRTTEAPPTARKVYETLDAAEKSAIDEGALIDQAVRKHYMNYNLQVVASQEMLSKLLSDQQSTTGPVTDFILGANVSGTEWTTTDISVELRPGKNVANLDLILNGVTQSSTVGVTDQASIYTSGYHRWSAKKPLRFDGKTIVATGPAEMTSVQPSNTTTGASTRYSGMPLFGSIADSTAVQQANMRRGESEAIAAQRLESRVLPEFDAQRRPVDPKVRRAAAVRSAETATTSGRASDNGPRPIQRFVRSVERRDRWSGRTGRRHG